MDAPEKKFVIPISGPRSGEPSEPPDTPRSAGSRAPGEERPPASRRERPEPDRLADGEAAAGDGETKAAAEVPDEGGGPDEFDDLLMSLRAALEEGEEAAVAGEAGEPSEAKEGDEDAAEAEEVGDDFTFPDWLGGIDAEAEQAAEILQGINQTGAPESAAAPNRPPPPEAPPRRRYVYRSFESSRVEAHKLACRVTLASAGREYSGVAEGAAIPGVRAEIAARATLDAVSGAEDGAVVLSLIAARVLRFVDLPLVVVSVYGVNGDEVKRLVGAAPVDNSEEQAAVLATLQATDRWLAATALGY